jgi:hypothetical protein
MKRNEGVSRVQYCLSRYTPGRRQQVPIPKDRMTYLKPLHESLDSPNLIRNELHQ